ncbi:MAG: thioredoxin-dependent thiol peroxidase [Acidimicrobiia bacterium]|nr:thioredoxin-dependent thiol peroxidase [Acidimicrobiia bacterium]
MKLEPGDNAPGFSLPDDEGKVRSAEDFAGKRLVVYFYPKAFTPGCTGESCDFRDNHERFAAAGYQILGVSPDPVDRLAKFRDEYELPFPLLSDANHAMAEAFGAWGIKKNYGREYEGIIRSTFVIDADGLVEHAWYNVRAKEHVARVSANVLGGDAEGA